MNLYTSPSLSSDNNYVLLHRSATGCCTDRGMRMFSSLICKDIGETWTVCFALISSNIAILIMVALGAGWWASPAWPVVSLYNPYCNGSRNSCWSSCWVMQMPIPTILPRSGCADKTGILLHGLICHWRSSVHVSDIHMCCITKGHPAREHPWAVMVSFI